jgi:hypothetical protein
MKEGEGGIVDGTFQWINKIQYTTDVMAQFTGLIMMNAEAIYTSYSSFIGLLEVSSEQLTKFLLMMIGTQSPWIYSIRIYCIFNVKKNY